MTDRQTDGLIEGQTDGRTDGQTQDHNRYRASIASRGIMMSELCQIKILKKILLVLYKKNKIIELKYLCYIVTIFLLSCLAVTV